jgi:hypothetical protein
MAPNEPETMLTAHFSRREVTRSALASRLGIPNRPTAETWANALALAQNVLEPARAALGPITITSWYRSPDLNRLTPGSSIRSQHCLGQAADCEILPRGNVELWRWMIDHAPFDQIIWEFGDDEEPAWVHVSYREENRRASILRAYRRLRNKKSRTVYVQVDRADALKLIWRPSTPSGAVALSGLRTARTPTGPSDTDRIE